jgi:hypothetical protein
MKLHQLSEIASNVSCRLVFRILISRKIRLKRIFSIRRRGFLLLFLVPNYALRLDVSHEETRTLPNRTATYYVDLFAATQYDSFAYGLAIRLLILRPSALSEHTTNNSNLIVISGLGGYAHTYVFLKFLFLINQFLLL